ncbi:MAG: orotidine 5'-phosphate decarboxylase [Thaumarchaeota archaeon]|nr:orotidine 5'-phosphate decarboxylase [Nitrososphaerota archaeon]
MTGFRKRIERISSVKGRIILANDLDDTNVDKLEKKTIFNIKRLGKYLCAVKLNFHVMLPLGEKSLSKINQLAHREGLQTIADMKLNDIGNTNMIAIKRLWKCGFDAVIANPIMGPENLRELVSTAHSDEHGVIALVHMSHPGAKLGYGLAVRDPATKKIQKLHNLFLKWSYSSNVDGIVVGATVPDIISYTKKAVRGRCDIYSPGVGTQGGDARKSLQAGSRYLIVGRTILNSKNQILEAEKLQRLSLES